MTVSKETRKDIFDSLLVLSTKWSGRFDEVEFLKRIFELEQMPSNDNRYSTALDDILQHRVYNSTDWGNDWVFSDSRFNLVNCEDSVFLRFLCEMIHPAVRIDDQEVKQLIQIFNDILTKDGFEIVESTRIADRPVYQARQKIENRLISINSAKELAVKFDAEYLNKQVMRLEASVLDDPELAIGTAKEFVETCCKTILIERDVEINNNWNLSQLVKNTCKTLKLTPDDIPDTNDATETIKKVLGNLGAVTQGLAELRNDYGTGHGRDAKARGLNQRHAKLAVGSATTLAIFLFETHQDHS